MTVYSTGMVGIPNQVDIGAYLVNLDVLKRQEQYQQFIMNVKVPQTTFVQPATIGLANLASTKSRKKGINMNPKAVNCADIAASGATWYYNWSPRSNNCPGVEFVPMVWSEGKNLDSTLANLPQGSEWLLGFNEPNLKGQADMTPQRAASLWPKLEKTGRKLVAPAMAMPGTTWFAEFMRLCKNCRIDAIAIHTYEKQVGGITHWINTYAKYGKPLWLTEFAQPGTSNVQQCQSYIKSAVTKLENDPRVQRYAWFLNRSTKTTGNLVNCGSLFDSKGIKEIGKTYRDS